MKTTTLESSLEQPKVIHEGVESVPKDPDTWDAIVANFGQAEDRLLGEVATLREELHSVFRESPAESIIAEATNFANLYYQDRIVEEANGDRVFFTRDTRTSKARKLDSVTTIKQTDASTTVVVDMIMDYGYDAWFRITVDTTGAFGVQKLDDARTYPMGEVQNPSDIGHILAKYVDMSITAASKVRERDDTEREAANEDAQERYQRAMGRTMLSGL